MSSRFNTIVLTGFCIIGFTIFTSGANAAEAAKTLQAGAQQLATKLAQAGRGVDVASPARTARLLNESLAETSSSLANVGRLLRNQELSTAAAASIIGAEREKIEQIDQQEEAMFSSIEAKLRAAGLNEKVAAVEKSATDYRAQMSGLKRDLDALASGTLEPDTLKSSLQSMIARLDGNRTQAIIHPSGNRRPELPERSGPPVRLTLAPEPATTPPATSDLAASKVVQLTAGIAAAAQSLGNDPVRLYAWVHDNVQYLPYMDARQNSQAVLWSRQGNDLDQATLLIALLRASQIPARYVTGTIRLSTSDAANWVGVKDPAAAQKAFAYGFLGLQSLGNQISLNHTWVEAYFDSGQGPQWVSLDPSFKLRSYQTGIVIPKLPYNRGQFLSSVQTLAPSDLYLNQVLAYVRQNNPGSALEDVPYTGPVMPADTSTAPTALPYPVDNVVFRQSEEDRSQQARVTISVFDLSAPSEYLSPVTLYIPEICTQSLSLSFGAATAADQKALDLFGGILGTPAAVASVVPQVRLDNNIVATGTSAPPIGQQVVVQLDIFDFYGKAPVHPYHLVTVGDTAALLVGGVQYSDAAIAAHIDTLVNQPSALASGNSDNTVREILAIAGMRFFRRRALARQQVCDSLQLKNMQVLPEEAATIGSVQVQNLFDRPFIVTPSALLIDTALSISPLVDVNTANPAPKNIQELLGDTSSSLEHQVWEEMVLIPSVSTVKILQLAQQANISAVTVTSVAGLNSLSYGSNIGSALASEISHGYTILIPQRSITYGNFTGTGWIAEAPDGTAFYYIADLTQGGKTAGPPTKQNTGPGGNGKGPGTTQDGDPVTISNGNLFHQEQDLVVRGPGLSVVLARAYNSQAAVDGPFGFGWTHTYNLSLKDNQSSVTYTDGQGGSYDFPLQGSAYVSAPGLDMKLTKDAQGYSLRTKTGVNYRFSTGGKLQNITDPNGNTIALSYDGGGRLQSITDTAGRVLSLTVDGQAHITGVRDASGRSLSYTYDGSGNLVSFTDGAGNQTTYTYYSGQPFNHNLKSITSPEGNTLSYEYYGNGKVSRMIRAGNATTSFFYLPFSNQTTVADERGFSTTYQFNAAGNVTRIIKPDGNLVDRVFNSDEWITSVTDERGFITRFDRDALGNATRVVDALGNITVLTYEPNFSRLTSIQDARGNIARFDYDSKGNLLKRTDALGGVTQFSYNPAGQVATIVDAEGDVVTLSYDAQGNVTSFTDPVGNSVRYQLDSVGRLTGLNSAAGDQFSVSMNALNWPVNAIDPLGNSWTGVYDRNGSLSGQTDANGHTFTYNIDQLGQLAKVTDAKGGVSQYSYAPPECACTATNVLSSFQDAKGQTWSYAYDFAGRLTSDRDPLGNVTTYSYDAAGNLSRKTDANGASTTFEYDAIGRLTRKAFSDGTDSRFTYDAVGNLLSASNQNVALQFTYDALNRITAATDSRGPRVVSYIYDRAGRRISMTDPNGGAFLYAYDKNGRVAAATNPNGAVTQFTYDADGRRLTRTHANGVQVAYQYDAGGRLTGLTDVGPSGSLLAQAMYTYDPAGNPLTMTDLAGTHSYVYDELDRLVAATHPVSSAESYSYDPVGNRAAWSYDAANRLLATDSVSFTYDHNGNTSTRSDGTAYTYDLENRLTQVSLSDGRLVTYKYDPFGRRIEKNVDGSVVQYFYDQQNVLLEMDGSGQTLARYTNGPGLDVPLIMERGGQSYFYSSDAMGSIVRITDPSGAAVQGYA
ncbi:MAG TPA: DUF6531 domain-containing protein, partial [Bryobacteraceae bacterium]|nr:DUF6531 domain-containing protein [Bryobacteraceae bacterium]